MKEAIAIGIDIGGTSTKLGLVKENGDIIFRKSFETKAKHSFNIFFDTLSENIGILIQVANTNHKIKSIGIGAPNGNYFDGSIVNPPNFRWQGKILLKQLIENKFSIPCFLTNDANAAAIGEMNFGLAKGMENFIMLTLGTGLGSGIVVNGKLVYGHTGFAGELGHVIIHPNGRLCGDGRKGCLEAYVSVTGICTTALELLKNTNSKSILRNLNGNKVNGKAIHEAAQKQDPIALEAFDITGKILGEFIADAILFTSPEGIILGGGLANAKEFILKPTKKYMDKKIYNSFKDSVKLQISSLQEENAGILGAGALAWQSMR